MIIGNPDKFAILIDSIDEWNDPNSFWKEGIFDFIFQGKYLSEEIKDYTFNELLILGQKSFLPALIEDRELFWEDKEKAFKLMLDRYDPYILDPEFDADDSLNYSDEYIINKDYMSGTWVVAVCYENHVRLLGAIIYDLLKNIDNQGNTISSEWVKRKNISIHESIIHIKDYQDINKKIVSYFNKILCNP